MKIFKNEEAFTLIEVMVTIAIVAVIAVAVYNAYFGSLRAWNYNKNRLEVQRVQDLTHKWISQYTRKATSVNPIYTDYNLSSAENLLYLKYYDNSGNIKEIAFGRGSNSTDYLYFYNITNGTQKKISNLKFSSLSFNYINNLITVNAEIFNEEENTNYQFSSYFTPRLLK